MPKDRDKFKKHFKTFPNAHYAILKEHHQHSHQYQVKHTDSHPIKHPNDLFKSLRFLLKLESSLSDQNKNSYSEKFKEFLDNNPLERLKFEHPDSAEELKLVIDSLRTRGTLEGSIGISNLINAVIDEGRLRDPLVLKSQYNDPNSVYKNSNPFKPR